jgi:hypothetical protein
MSVILRLLQNLQWLRSVLLAGTAPSASHLANVCPHAAHHVGANSPTGVPQIPAIR